MKLKLQFICFLIALCAINVFNAFGQTNDRVFYTLDFTKKNATINSYTGTWNYPSNGINWTIFGASNYKGTWNYVRTGGKDNSKGQSYYESKEFISGNVSQIVMYSPSTSTSTNPVKSITLFVYSDKNHTSVIDKVVINNAKPTKITFIPSKEGIKWRNAYYKFLFSWSNDKDNNYGKDVQKVQFLKSADDVKLTIGKTGYSTLYYSDRAFYVPAGVEALTYNVEGGKLFNSKKYTQGYIIPKDEAVVLNGEQGSYWFDKVNSTKVRDENNMLKGTDEAVATSGGDIYYKLSLNSKREEGSVGFYWGTEGGGAFTNGAHKAYLALDSQQAEAVKEFRLEDEVTKIDGVHGDGKEDVIGNGKKQAYNISGQRVDDNYKGLVIINGKKVIRR